MYIYKNINCKYKNLLYINMQIYKNYFKLYNKTFIFITRNYNIKLLKIIIKINLPTFIFINKPYIYQLIIKKN